MRLFHPQREGYRCEQIAGSTMTPSSAHNRRRARGSAAGLPPAPCSLKARGAVGKTATAMQARGKPGAAGRGRQRPTDGGALTLPPCWPGDAPRLIDEWQLEPAIWNHVRRAVDERTERGQFILTGSAMPADDITRHTSGRWTLHAHAHAAIISMRNRTFQWLHVAQRPPRWRSGKGHRLRHCRSPSLPS